MLAIFAAVALLVAVVIWFWPRSAYQTYLSPSLDARGTRIKMLVPAGWQADENSKALFLGRTFKVVHVRPRHYFDRWPRWIVRFLRLDNSEISVVRIWWIPISPGEAVHGDRAEQVREVTFKTGQKALTAHRAFPALNGRMWLIVDYTREDRAAFQRTHKTIMNSIQVVK